MRDYTVLIAFPVRADLRIFQVAADNLFDANELAAEAVARLSPKMIEAISRDASDDGAHIDPFVIVDVYEECLELPCDAWSREDVMALVGPKGNGRIWGQTVER
jgi:hypothetical protein